MGNSESSTNHDGTLQELFKDFVNGRLPADVKGVILGRTSAMEPKVLASIYESLGSLEDIHLVGFDDLDEFEIEVVDPEKTIDYVPFFFNRRGEYGRKHSYWEGLCHVSTGSNRWKFIKSASARYTTPIVGTSIESVLCPATIEISALVECIRTINIDFLNSLRDELLQAGLAERLATNFVEGAFRNVAIQIHFNDPSLSTAATMHVDHINSALHMAVTIHGSRTVSFEKSDRSTFDLNLKQGDVYLTSPTSVMHGVSVPKLAEEQRSVALQLRTLLDVETANDLNLKGNNADILLVSMHKVLDLYQNRIRMPSFDEYQHALRELKNQKQQDGCIVSGQTTIKTTFKNTFVITKPPVS
eukprot:TRINITY_DN193_c0_g1_i1.p1 TRINITY_DN193_c0_g1~~TRINITY_DN193_c0_g1_i1.p1  ORF type:complete len:358 (+),score=79.40 TRINITY_DN193_c0_g1_i1:1351-2424(+)